ncbi:MAG: 4-hydroxy-tetrahydrodipicolinate reductase [Rickettsiales bacterium]|nr:4-hydroxy-tetrahydrodipicolinate reductase [Rickettsiales bacterium]
MDKSIIAVGTGKMGTAFINEARNAGYNVNVFDKDSTSMHHDLTALRTLMNDPWHAQESIIVDFTLPDAFMENIELYTKHRNQVVVGTTGWFADPEKLQYVKDKVGRAGTGLIYSGNYSLGVQATYFALNALSEFLGKIGGFDSYIVEEHHTNKADSPSGTAVEMAKTIIKNMPNKTEMLVGNSEGKIKPEQLQILSSRFSKVFGTHTAAFEDANQRIEISHRSDSRSHFAQGAVQAIEFIRGRIGVFTMQDFIREKFFGNGK